MPPSPKQLNLWFAACAHVHSDLKHGRRSLADAIEQSENGGAGDGSGGGPPFDWDALFFLGDFVGSQLPPTDEDATAVLEQLNAGKSHGRERIYALAGNLDASGPDEETQWWFRKYLDPAGENPAVSGVRNDQRPYPVVGTWENYRVDIGNVSLLMMSDRNDGGPPQGRSQKGGWPAGAMSEETFAWWRRALETNEDRILISCAHHVLRDTTTASGRFEGVEGGYHKRYKDAEGASHLYYIGKEDSADRFEDVLRANPGKLAFWFGGHTHTYPDDTYGDKSLVETVNGVTFCNASALTRHHGSFETATLQKGQPARKFGASPMSRLLTFTEGSNEALLRCYLHTSDYAPQGWYAPQERRITLPRAFSFS
ncbi:MAG: metallophosphoesterase [Rhodospirillales bacterium]